MFERHQYTCPDVIHLQNKARRNVKTQLGVVAGLFLVSYGVTYVERRKSRRPNLTIVPDPS